MDFRAVSVCATNCASFLCSDFSVAPIWSVALRVSSDSCFTSEATTAKPLPASPARAASIVALSASRMVCLAIAYTWSAILATVLMSSLRTVVPVSISSIAAKVWSYGSFETDTEAAPAAEAGLFISLCLLFVRVGAFGATFAVQSAE